MSHAQSPGGAGAPLPPPDPFDSRATAHTRAAQPNQPAHPAPVNQAHQAGYPPPGGSMPPMATSIPAPSPLPIRRATGAATGQKKPFGKIAAIAGAVLLGVLLLTLGGLGIASAVGGEGFKEAVVRVATPTGNGTGFFVQGPDELAYVATAFHVVAGGERILIERNIATGDDEHYVEAYPETEVVAYDADADIAIIRIKNLRGDQFARMDLAETPMANEEVRSYGFPGSKITRRTGLIEKDGKLLSLVKFPVFDHQNKTIIRENAIDGLLVSTDIEPGFSGGPTVNGDGEVVGINVTKDMAHRGQNGVVHVRLLKELLGTVKPAAAPPEPSPEEVAAMLTKVQRELLLLPVGERVKQREHGFISAGELPHLRRLIDEIRRHERDNYRAPGGKLSGRAAFGLWAAQMAGTPLETYLSKEVQDKIAKCERTSARLVSLFSEVADGDQSRADQRAMFQACDEIALRPLALDLLAATLQWSGEERTYAVTKVERIDEGGHIYKAMVRVSGIDNLLPIWLTSDYGTLRVKLFDRDGKLYGAKSAAEVATSDIAGDWELLKPRAPHHKLPETDVASIELVTVSVQGSKVTVRHVTTERAFATDKGVFRCNAQKNIETGWVQSYAGELDKGVIVAARTKDAQRVGRDAGRCRWGAPPSEMAVLKLHGGKLVMYRTDGVAYPEMIELRRPQPKTESSDDK